MDFKDFERARMALEKAKVPVQYNLGAKPEMERELLEREASAYRGDR